MIAAAVLKSVTAGRFWPAVCRARKFNAVRCSFRGASGADGTVACSEDEELGERVPKQQRAQLWRDIATAAESGWDFSSRWCAGSGGDLAAIRTTRVVPVDLNTFLWKLECVLAQLAAAHRSGAEAVAWRARAAARRESMTALMWNAAAHKWTDLLLVRTSATSGASVLSARTDGELSTATRAPGECGSQVCSSSPEGVAGRCDAGTESDQGVGEDVCSAGEYCTEQLGGVFASSWMPVLFGMLSGVEREPDMAKAVVRAMRASGLVQAGGLSTSLEETGQQWDAPNCWPPLLCMWVDGLMQYGGEEGAKLAAQLGETYLTAAAAGWSRTGCMWEKYSAAELGACGGGGEYNVQVGFGWTNGVLLHLAIRYGFRVRPR